MCTARLQVVFSKPKPNPFQNQNQNRSQNQNQTRFKTKTKAKIKNNEHRKVLARMATRVLDEVCGAPGTGLTPAQQAFLKGRDITECNVKLHTAMANATREARFLALLSTDCSKGYNRVGWEWLELCLTKANLPAPLRRAVKAFLHNVAYLAVGGREVGQARFLAGLPQGCPLSCYLYIIAIDPYLARLDSVVGAEATTAFVDDWCVACSSTAALGEAMAIVNRFEGASGQVVNEGKSAVVPSRPLTPAELASIRSVWPQVKVAPKHRLLGLYIGFSATIEDQFAGPMAKFESKVATYSPHRDRLGTATRITVCNAFFLPIFGYVGRHFVMPDPLLRRVERLLLEFVAPLKSCPLHVFTHLGGLYGIRVNLVDLRMANFAGVLMTVRRNLANRATIHASIASRWVGERLVPALAGVPDPALAWATATAAFRKNTGDYPDVLVSRELARRGVELGPMDPWPAKWPLFAWFYRALREAAAPTWQSALAARISGRRGPDGACLGLDGAAAVRRLRFIPRSIGQGQRWMLFKVHFKACGTTSKRHQAGKAPRIEQCCFCGRDEDRIDHLLDCPRVRVAVAELCVEHRPRLAAWGFTDYFLQRELGGETVQLLLGTLTAIWRLRDLARGGFELGDDVAFRDNLRSLITCPWLMGSEGRTLCRKERRALNLRAPRPVPAGWVLYRSDGASRRQGLGGFGEAGWGAAVWVGRAAEPTATSRGYLGTASNNVAEYRGLLACMRRATRKRAACIMFQVDSMLLARHQNFAWACRTLELRPYYEECVNLGRQLTRQGKRWQLQHVYREFNGVADALANEGVDDPTTEVFESGPWRA